MQQSWPAVLTRPDEYLPALRSISEAFGMVGNPLPTSLRAGAPLGEIGQVLRQRSPGSAAAYARVDVERLRTIARPWPAGAAS